MLSQIEKDALHDLNKCLKSPLSEVKRIKHETVGYLKKNDKITGLGLYNQELGRIPENIFKFENLKILNLYNNQIQIIQGELFKLQFLEVLIQNQISLKN
jgi:Leucine-rich repeat (LRR) protein